MAQENEIKKLADLTPDGNNYNKGTEKGRKLIGKSLKKLGAGRSILIDKDGNVIAGNKTLEGAAAAGIDEVIVVKTTGRQIVAVQRTDLELDSQKGREMALADNATGAANLSWDLEMMAADGWTETDLSGWGVDMPEAEPVKAEAFEDDFDPPAEIEEIQTDIVLGDLFEIGEHRLLCGDSTKAEDVERLMGGEKADMVFTDPPYKIETKGGCKGSIGKSLKKQGSDIEFISNFDPSDFLLVMPDLFAAKKMNAYVFCNKSLLPNYLNWAVEKGYSYNVLIWRKPNAIPIGDSHRPDIEYLLLFRLSAIWNSSVPGVNYSRCLDFGRESGLHPTMKPVGLVGNEMQISSNILSIVVDPFLGSGTTMVAAHQLNRRCFGMEIDPKYCQVILDRMRKLAPDLEIKKNGQPWTKTEA